jgi:hypothetical protein
MSGKVCRDVRREIDQSELGQSLSAAAEAHVAACPGCAEFRGERSHLRELVGALRPVIAPADFDMRLRARLARERDVPRQNFIFRFVLSTPGIVVAAILVLVVGIAVFTSQRKPQGPSVALGGGGNPAATPAPAPAAAAKDENSETVRTTMPDNANQGKSKQSTLLARNAPRLTAPVNAAPQVEDLSVKGAQIVRAASRPGEVSLLAPLKPMVVTIYDEHGTSRKIQLPPISFGSQRLTDNRVPVSMTNSKEW